MANRREQPAGVRQRAAAAGMVFLQQRRDGLQVVNRPPGARQDALAILGGHHAAVMAFEQRDVQRGFKVADRPGYR